MEEGKRIAVLCCGPVSTRTGRIAQMLMNAGMQLVVEPTDAKDYQTLKGYDVQDVVVDECSSHPYRSSSDNLRILQRSALKRRAKK